MPSHATHEDAKLLLQLYDLRREKRLRQARDFVGRDLKFKDYKDFQKRFPNGSKGGLFIGMVLGYWDMACTLVVKGLIAEDLFNATNYEHVAVWQKLKPIIEAWRKQYNYPEMAKSLEAVTARHPALASVQAEDDKKGKAKKKPGADKDRKSARSDEAARKVAKPRVDEDEDEDDEDVDAVEPDDEDDE
jgi:hypothetical protein